MIVVRQGQERGGEGMEGMWLVDKNEKGKRMIRGRKGRIGRERDEQASERSVEMNVHVSRFASRRLPGPVDHRNHGSRQELWSHILAVVAVDSFLLLLLLLLPFTFHDSH